MKYQLTPTDKIFKSITMVIRVEDNAFIPFAINNTDYQQFKIDVSSGVELQDPDGNVMTQKQVNDFLKTIP